MNRKILCGVLALLLVLAVAFTGCQSNSSSSASGSGSTSGSDSGSGSGSGSTDLEAVTLEYYMPEKAMTDAQMVWDEINKYVQEKINATVNIHWIEWAEYSQRMSAIIGAGQEFDLLASPTSVLNFAVNANNGAYAELDDLLTEYAPELLEEVPAFVLEGGKVNGKIYGVPSYKDVADSYSVIWYTDLAQEWGVDESKLTSSWKWLDDKYDAFVEFKEKRDAAHPEYAELPMVTSIHDGLNLWSSSDEIINGVVTNVGNIEYFEGQGSGEKVFNVFATPEFVEIAKNVRKWVDAGLMPQFEATPDPDGALKKSGAVPMGTGQGYVAIAENLWSEDHQTVMCRSDIALSSTAYLQSAITAVSRTSQNPERAVMFMNLQYSDTYIATASRFGIEGTHYNIVQDDEGNDRLDFKGTANDVAAADRPYYNWYGAQWGNLFKCILPADQPDNFYTALEEMNVESEQFETNLGFVFDQEPVVNEIAACAGVIDEYKKPLMKGAYPADQIETVCAEFVEKLNANGMDKIVEEAQKQLNEWRAANGKSTYEG